MKLFVFVPIIPIVALAGGTAHAQNPEGPPPAPVAEPPPSPAPTTEPPPAPATEPTPEPPPPPPATRPEEEPPGDPKDIAPPVLFSPARFGDRGQWVIISTSSSANISSESFSNSAANFMSAGIEIGVDRFLARDLSIGIDASTGYSDNKGYGASTLTEAVSWSVSGGVRLGVNVPLGRLFSWYPRLTIGLETTHSTSSTVTQFAPNQSAPPDSTATRTGPWINLYLPLLVHPAPHFFAGFGPRIQPSFGTLRGGPYDGSQTLLVSADLTIGGWWGGQEGHAPATEPADRPNRFGAHGTLVLTSAAEATVSAFRYSQSGASSVGASFAPSFDYFAWDNVSVGGSVSVAYSKATFFDSSGLESDASTTSFGLAPRAGANVDVVSGVLSWWPTIELGFGVVEQSITSAFGANILNRKRVWAQLSGPLLLHVSPHFFMGAGPFLFQELSDKYDTTGYENNATSVGATFLLGGWL